MNLIVANESHFKYAQTICDTIAESAKVRGTGIAKRTPEYIQKIKSLHPDCEVYTIRLDRGLSTDKALNSIPGEFPNEERGLNDNQYIVPGAGGIGELLNNSFV